MPTKNEKALIRAAEKLVKTSDRMFQLQGTRSRSKNNGNGSGSIMAQRAQETHDAARRDWNALVERIQGEVAPEPAKRQVGFKRQLGRGRSAGPEAQAITAAQAEEIHQMHPPAKPRRGRPPRAAATA